MPKHLEKHLAAFMFCLVCFVKCSENHSTVAPITRIIKNYEKHLQKLKDKYENLHGKRSRLKERSTDSSDKDDVIDDWTKSGEDDKDITNPIPIALSPFEVPIQEIGMLPEPSTNAPIFPHRRRIKYFMKYVKSRSNPKSTTPKALISGDTIKGTEKPVYLENSNSSESTESLTRIDGESRRDWDRLEQEVASIRRVKHIAEGDNLSEIRESLSKSKSEFDTSSEMKRRKSGRLDQLNFEKRQKKKTLPIVNLFKATMKNEKYRGLAEKATETLFPDIEAGTPKEKPIQENLPIKRLEDAKPVVNHDNELSSDEDSNDLPFLMRPDLFNIISTTTQIPYTYAATTIEPTTAIPQKTTSASVNRKPVDLLMEDSPFVTENPSLTTESTSVESQPSNDKSVEVSNTVRPTQKRNYLPTDHPQHASTIVDSMELNELEPADLDLQVDFEKLYRGGPRRKGMEFYAPDKDESHYEEETDDEDFRYYPRKKYYNKQHRFGFRRKPMRHSYYEDDDFDFYPMRSRAGLRFPLRVHRPQALAIPVAASIEDQEVERVEHEAGGPMLRPKSRYSTRRTGIVGEKRSVPLIDPSPRNKASSPEDQGQAAPQNHPKPKIPVKTQAELQMSAENCRKVQNYSVLFGVPDPQAWVRKNCAFVKTFVSAPCDDINTFVDSCYRFKKNVR